MSVKNSRPNDPCEDARNLRCPCGSVMARVTVAGLELKCRRCKRVITVAVPRTSRAWIAVDLHDQKGPAA